MRILHSNILKITKLWFDKDILKKFLKIVYNIANSWDWWLVLIAGVTNSGKSTTFYSIFD